MTTTGVPACAMIPESSSRQRAPASALTEYMRALAITSKFVPERGTENPRPKRCLRLDELVGADEHTLVRIGEILAVHVQIPRVLGDPERRIVGCVRRILEAQPAGADPSGLRERRIRTRLREGVAAVRGGDLHERRVSGKSPLVAGTQAELERRRIRGRGADGTERVGDGHATAAVGV